MVIRIGWSDSLSAGIPRRTPSETTEDLFDSKPSLKRITGCICYSVGRAYYAEG